MRNGYHLAALICLAICSITLTAFAAEQVDFTVYVHEGNINGTALSGVQVTGNDAAGNNFAGTTDSDGAATLSGLPGTWQFVITKTDYGTLKLNYNVTKIDFAKLKSLYKATCYLCRLM